MKSRPKKSIDDLADYFALNLRMLWYMGIVINLSDKGRTRPFRLIERLPTFTTNAFGIVDGFLQVLWIFDALVYEKHLVTQISSNFLSNVTAICKGLRLATTVEPLRLLLHEISAIWRTNLPRSDAYREHIFTEAKRGRFYTSVYAILGVGTLIAWGLPPLQNILLQYLYHDSLATNHTYDYSQRIFMVRYPFAVDTAPRFIGVLLEEQWILFGSVLFWICSDALFAQLSIHVCLQLQILQHDIEYLVNHESDENNLKKNFIIIAKRHQHLLRICDKIETIFSPIMFTTMLISSLNICVNVFELREVISRRNFADASEHVFLLIGLFLQIIIYCIFAESLTIQTSSIGDAIYNCKWTEKNHKFRFYMQIIILKSQRPFYCTAYGFFPMNYNRLTIIVKGAMSYYMYLQTTG